MMWYTGGPAMKMMRMVHIKTSDGESLARKMDVL